LIYLKGWWRESQPNIHECSEFNNIWAKQWAQENSKLWLHLSNILHRYLPSLYDIYMQLPLITRSFGAFPMCVLNLDFACKRHKDQKDFRNGLCFDIPFGDWIGGNIILEEVNIEVKVKPGDLFIFDSSHIHHWIEKYEGRRNSVILTAHNNLFFPNLQTK